MNIRNIDAQMLTKMFIQGTNTLKNNVDVINSLNVFPVPDGDTGTNMTLTMESAISKIEGDTCDEVSRTLSRGCLMGARGNSGVILSQIFRGLSKGMKDKKSLSVKDFALALLDAKETAYSAVLKPVEGTILTVIRFISDKAKEIANEDISFTEFFEIIISEGETTLSKTPEMLPVLKQAGVVDAGGKGLIFFLHGMLDALNGKEVSVHTREKSVAQTHFATEDINFTYCTEFIIDNVVGDTTKLMQKIESLGDSMVFVRDENLVKVHIHTNDPGIALSEALKYGSLVTTKIENMKLQHSEIIGNTLGDKDDQAQNEVPYDDDFGFISVSPGIGFTRLLNELGVAGIIEGGQTMNPSTEDFLSEIEKCPSKNIYLFPNNSNIILAANQAKEISPKNVYVIPTKTLPQNLTAMLSFNPELSGDELADAFMQAIQNVTTISVTKAVRDTQMNGLDILEGSYIAIAGSELVATSFDCHEVILEAMGKFDNFDLVSIFYGTDADKQDAAILEEKIINLCGDDTSVDIFEGGQPVYHYIISLE